MRMAESSDDFGDEHLVIHLEASGPIELNDLHESLAALARIYARQYIPDGSKAPAPRLYVTRVSSGSIDLEIVPLLAILGMPIAAMDSVLIIKQFSEWLGLNIRAFADSELPPRTVSIEDGADLKTFIRPLTGKRGAELRIAHAKFHKKEKDDRGEREVFVEYGFTESDINRAAINLDKLEDASKLVAPVTKANAVEKEVLMAFQRVDKGPGKERGRTGDRVIIEKISPRPLPVYFPSEAGAIKR
jgi:hypothetical protein